MFETLITPYLNQQFWEQYWGQQYIHIPRNNHDYYANIVTIQDVDNLIQNQHTPATFFRVVHEGRIVPLDQISKFLTFSTTRSAQVILPEKVLAYLNKGATIILEANNHTIPSLSKFCYTLERELGYQIKANIYVTPPHSQGFGVHYDAHDVFVMQLSGTKVWHLYADAAFDTPIDTQRFDKDKHMPTADPSQIIELQPGDTLYVPRGYLHAAATNETTSIHVTVSVHPTYWLDIIRDLAVNTPLLRQAIPNDLMTEAQQTQQITDIRAALMTWLQDADLEAALHESKKSFQHNKTHSYQGRFIDILKAHNITETTVVQRRPDKSLTIKQEEKHLLVSFGSKTESYPLFFKSLFIPLQQWEPFTVQDLKGLATTTSKIKLITHFVQQGLLTIVNEA